MFLNKAIQIFLELQNKWQNKYLMIVIKIKTVY